MEYYFGMSAEKLHKQQEDDRPIQYLLPLIFEAPSEKIPPVVTSALEDLSFRQKTEAKRKIFQSTQRFRRDVDG